MTTPPPISPTVSSSNGSEATHKPFGGMPSGGEELTANQLQWVESLVDNIYAFNRDFLSKFFDPRRNIDDECGYPTDGEVTAERLRTLWTEEAIAARVVEVLAKESWQVQPTVYESEDSDEATEFENAWDELGNQLHGGEQSFYQDESGSIVWDYLARADRLSGIGQYGVILLGINDGKTLDQPAEFVKPPKRKTKSGQTASPEPTENVQQRKLMYLRVFPEYLAQITQWETEESSPRFGQPVKYLLTFNDPRQQQGSAGVPLGTKEVHWTRVIHIADNVESNEVLGVSRMRPVLRRLLDLEKMYAADGEGYWKNCFAQLWLETHPQLGGDVKVDRTKIRDMMENMQNGLQKWGVLMGMSAKTTPPGLVDPTPHIMVQIEAICIKLGIPKRIFMGTERGELASSQDDAAWNDRLRQRQKDYITPRIIVVFVNRLILLGVLPIPKGFSVEWPDLTSQTEQEKADVAVKKTQAIVAYAGGGEAVMTPMDFLTRIMGMDEDDAHAVVENTAKVLEGEVSDTGGSALLGMAGGITGMIELFKLAKEGGLSEEQLKQQIMLFFKVDEERADQIIADGLTTAATDAGEPPAPEPMPTSPVKVRAGESLVNPDDGEEIAAGPPLPPKPPTRNSVGGGITLNQLTTIMANVYCPNGEGGGVDPTCSTEEGISSFTDEAIKELRAAVQPGGKRETTKSLAKASELLAQKVAQLDQAAQKHKSKGMKIAIAAAKERLGTFLRVYNSSYTMEGVHSDQA